MPTKTKKQSTKNHLLFIIGYLPIITWTSPCFPTLVSHSVDNTRTVRNWHTGIWSITFNLIKRQKNGASWLIGPLHVTSDEEIIGVWVRFPVMTFVSLSKVPNHNCPQLMSMLPNVKSGLLRLKITRVKCNKIYALLWKLKRFNSYIVPFECRRCIWFLHSHQIILHVL